MNPLWTLAPIGLVAGAVAMWLFRRLADRHALRIAANRIQAHLLEFWLFVDEPASVWKSWRGLLAANARLLRLLLVPLAAISLPMVPLFFWLDSVYGRAPLPPGKPVVVTAGCAGPRRSSSRIFANPKSRIRGMPSSATRMFDGLRSR